jgi:hypothetical protein
MMERFDMVWLLSKEDAQAVTNAEDVTARKFHVGWAIIEPYGRQVVFFVECSDPTNILKWAVTRETARVKQKESYPDYTLAPCTVSDACNGVDKEEGTLMTTQEIVDIRSLFGY